MNIDTGLVILAAGIILAAICILGARDAHRVERKARIAATLRRWE